MVSDLLRERLSPTREYVESLISIQRSYINTNHPDFIAMSAVERSAQKKKHEVDRRRLSAVSIGGSGDSSVNRDEREKSVTNAMNNLSVHQAGDKSEREREKAIHVSQHGGPNSLSASALNGSLYGSTANKEGFLPSLLLFGQRTDRPAVQENLHSPGLHNVAKEMVTPKTVLDGEPLDFDRKLDPLSDSEELTSLNDREDMETQIIRKCGVLMMPSLCSVDQLNRLTDLFVQCWFSYRFVDRIVLQYHP